MCSSRYASSMSTQWNRKLRTLCWLLYKPCHHRCCNAYRFPAAQPPKLGSNLDESFFNKFRFQQCIVRRIRMQHCSLLLSLLFLTVLSGRNPSTRRQSKSYYDLLGIRKNADSQSIKKAFRQQSIIHHPDKNPSDPDKAQKVFVQLSHAYEVLSDPDKRRVYDQLGEPGLQKPRPANGFHSSGSAGNNNPHARHKSTRNRRKRERHRRYPKSKEEKKQSSPRRDDEFFKNDQYVKRVLDWDGLIKETSSTDQPTIVYFYSPSCDHCVRNVKQLSTYAKDTYLWGLRWVAVSCAGTSRDLCSLQGIRVLPTFKFFAPGKTSTAQIHRGAFDKDIVGRWIVDSIRELTTRSDTVLNGQIVRSAPGWVSKHPLTIHHVTDAGMLDSVLSAVYHPVSHFDGPHIFYISPSNGKLHPPVLAMLSLRFRQQHFHLFRIDCDLLDLPEVVPVPSLALISNHDASEAIGPAIKGILHRLPSGNELWPKHHVVKSTIDFMLSAFELGRLFHPRSHVKELRDSSSTPASSFVLLFYGEPSYSEEVRLLDLISPWAQHSDTAHHGYEIFWHNYTRTRAFANLFLKLNAKPCSASSYYRCPRLLAFGRSGELIHSLSGLNMMQSSDLLSFFRNVLQHAPPRGDTDNQSRLGQHSISNLNISRHALEAARKLEHQCPQMLAGEQWIDSLNAGSHSSDTQACQNETSRVSASCPVSADIIDISESKDSTARTLQPDLTVAQDKSKQGPVGPVRNETLGNAIPHKSRTVSCDPQQVAGMVLSFCCYGDAPFPSRVDQRKCNPSKFYLFNSNGTYINDSTECKWVDGLGCSFERSVW